MKLKRLSLFLALVMIISAFAGTFTFTFAEETNKWFIGETSYATLKDAMTAAMATLNGDEAPAKVTIQLKGDVTEGSDVTAYPGFAPGSTSASIPEGKAIVVEGVSGKYDGEDKAARYPAINCGGSRYLQNWCTGVTVKNLTINSTDAITVIQVEQDLVLENVTINYSSTKSAKFAIVVAKGKKLTMNNSTINVTNSTAAQAIRLNGDGASVELDGSKINTSCHGIVFENSCKNASAIVKNSTISSSAEGYGIYFATGSGNTATVIESTLETKAQKQVVYMGAAGNTANFEGYISLRNVGTAPADSAIYATAANSTINFTNASVYESYSYKNSGGTTVYPQYQRIIKTAAASVTINVTNSSIWSRNSGGSLFELQRAGTEAAPNTITVNNSLLYSTGGPAIHTRANSASETTGYTDVIIENNSVVYGKTPILLKQNSTAGSHKGETKVTVTNSLIHSTDGVALTAVADTTVSIKDSAVYSANNNAISSTASMTTITKSGAVSSGTTFAPSADLGAVNAENADVIAAALGFAFRGADKTAAYADGAFTGYYRTLAAAVAGTQNVVQIANYTAVRVETLENAAGAVVVEMNGFAINSPAYERIANPKVSITFKNGKLNSRAASGVLQANGGTVLTLDNVDVVSNGKLNNAPIVVTVAGYTVNVINGSTITANMAYNNHIIYSTKADTIFNIIDSTITKTAVNAPIGFTGSNNNTGMINTTMQVTIANSTIDFSDDFKGRIIFMDDAKKAAASSLTLINSNFIASCGSGHISWYDASTIHMYGNNTFTGGDRLVEFAGAGYNSLYAVENEDEKFTPSIDTKNGAGIRTVKNSSGIRFISTISADVVAGLKAAVEDGNIVSYSFGTVVMKAADLEGTTVDAAIAAGAKNVAIKANTGIKENEDGSVDIFAALVNIKSTNLNTEFAGIAYIDITIQNGPDETKLLDPITIRIYSDYNEENNARSITEVAKKALGDVKTTSSDEIVEGFRYNNELAVGETYYVDGEAKVVGEGEKLYSAYNADQRKIIADYLA